MTYSRRLKTIIFRSRTFDFSEKEMLKYYFDLKQGKTRNRALATLLGCSERRNAEKFLRKYLTQNEYERISIELERKYPI